MKQRPENVVFMNATYLREMKIGQSDAKLYLDITWITLKMFANMLFLST